MEKYTLFGFSGKAKDLPMAFVEFELEDRYGDTDFKQWDEVDF